MTPRLNIFETADKGIKAMFQLEDSIGKSGLEHSLLELVRLRASQINGCAFCIYMHTNDALKHGEQPMRLHLVSAWRDSPLFTDRERAALNWAEALTNISTDHVSDEDFALLKSQFSDAEIGYLTLLIGSINAWNRIQKSLRAIHPAESRAVAAA